MGRKVLVLNQDYSALSVCSVPKAFLLVYMQKADLVAHSPDHVLRTVSEAYPMPTVVRLRRYVHLPYRGVMMTRQNIFKRDGNRCQYCGTHDNLTLDHVLPKSRGGKPTGTTSPRPASAVIPEKAITRPKRPLCRCGSGPSARPF